MLESDAACGALAGAASGVASDMGGGLPTGSGWGALDGVVTDAACGDEGIDDDEVTTSATPATPDVDEVVCWGVLSGVAVADATGAAVAELPEIGV